MKIRFRRHVDRYLPGDVVDASELREDVLDTVLENAQAVMVRTRERPGDEADETELSDLTVEELKDMARNQEIVGFSTMRKPELIEALSGNN